MQNIHRREEDIPVSIYENDIDKGTTESLNVPLHGLLERASSRQISRRKSLIQDYTVPLLHGDDGGSRGRKEPSFTSSSELRRLSLAVKGVHYAEIPVGRPPQIVKLAVSINSPYSIFPCAETVSGLPTCTSRACPNLRFKAHCRNLILFRLCI